MINPLWKGKINLQDLAEPKTDQGKVTFQSVHSVSSYDEFKLVMIKGVKDKESPITINFNPARASYEVQQWNDSFWGTTSEPSPVNSDLFKDFSCLVWNWTSLNWDWFSDQQQPNMCGKVVYDITYDYDAAQEEELEEGLFTTVQQIISPNMDIATKEKTIHDWIVNHVDYDNSTLTGDDGMGYTDYGAFFNGLAVCEGYARLTNRMLYMAGIPNLIVSGNATNSLYSDPSGHAWNMVKLNNDWYQLDVTWDDYGQYGDYTVYYDYYNVTDKVMSGDATASHIWDKTAYPQASQIFDASKYQGMTIDDNQCSIFRPDLCKNELDCIKIDGTWNGNYCIINQPGQLPDQLPVIDSFTSDITSGPVSLAVTFKCQAHDTDGSITAYQWDFDNDGTIDQITTDNTAYHVYSSVGTYQSICYAVDNTGKKTATDSIKITVNDNTDFQCPAAQSCLNFEVLNCDSSNICKQDNLFYKDDTLKLKLNIDSQTADPLKRVDLYVALMFPDGSFWFLTPNAIALWNGGSILSNMAYKQNIEQNSQSFLLLNFTVPQGMTGTYTVYAVFEKAGEALNLSSLLSNLAYRQIICK